MIDLQAIKDKWLNVCGACDAGIGDCTHPNSDYRPVILDLVSEVERLRATPAVDPAAVQLVAGILQGWKAGGKAAETVLTALRDAGLLIPAHEAGL